MPHILFVHLSVDGHLGCFHFLAVVNNAAGTICVCLCGHTFSFPLSSYPGLNSLVHIWRTARLMSFSLPPRLSTRWGGGSCGDGFWGGLCVALQVEGGSHPTSRVGAPRGSPWWEWGGAGGALWNPGLPHSDSLSLRPSAQRWSHSLSLKVILAKNVINWKWF